VISGYSSTEMLDAQLWYRSQSIEPGGWRLAVSDSPGMVGQIPKNLKSCGNLPSVTAQVCQAVNNCSDHQVPGLMRLGHMVQAG
jgi:hypothetical protein